ncbi:hypothetical protein KVT40_008760 [Elsinoe batatas]|uniref:Uncharacterized protein n=1 Tax=Elsinoe batatas TaxID=2601811 RepID=A0A8K0KW11_9PEZI|nr:hypothetical protein KVT40_008760 [Elsinoe batatas]
MPRPRSLRHSLPALVLALVVITATELWVSGFGLSDFKVPLNLKKSLHERIKLDIYGEDTVYPFNDGKPSLKCGYNIYMTDSDMCPNNDRLNTPICATASHSQQARPKINETTMYISNPPYENYFYSDCNVATQLVVTSPMNDSDLSIIGPRMIFAWPTGNSGACLFFEPQNGVNGSLAIEVINSTVGSPLAPVYIARDDNPAIGVTGVIKFNDTAVLSLSILGSIRAIRDYTEGPSLLYPEFQEKIQVKRQGHGVVVSRLWLDNVTTTTVILTPGGSNRATVKDGKATLEAGEYLVVAHINYPQMEQLSLEGVLRDESLAEKYEHETKALSFLSYSDKLLAGGWRFLTYFGRDVMISTLLLRPILSDRAIEATIGAVLERINRTDGSACHEETVGDFATFKNMQEGNTLTVYRCDYSMIDTDYFLPILMHAHFVEGRAGPDRLKALLSTPAGKVDPKNKGLKWGDLFKILANRILNQTAPFAAEGGQTRENLIHLKPGMETGVWRDSTYGIGGGRIPFDVNAGLAPAALRDLSTMAKEFGDIIAGDEADDWAERAEKQAEVWEDKSIDFFKVVLTADEVCKRLEKFVNVSSYYDGPSHADLIDHDYAYHTLALEGNNGLDEIPVMNSDASVRLLVSKGTNQTRLTDMINNTAHTILRPFPAGLMTPVGLVVANPAISGDEMVMANFSNSAYHGTVVWSWQLVTMVQGVEKQLLRCNFWDKPDFCRDPVVYGNLRKAYNALWDVIEKNDDTLSDEVWSWEYVDGKFKKASLGSLPPPPGAGGAAESDIIQLWSLTFLAVKRNEELRIKEELTKDEDYGETARNGSEDAPE